MNQSIAKGVRNRAARGAPRTQTALRGALLALLEEQSLERITVREITARAGVGYATFFRRYPDKDALLHDLAASEIGNLLTMTLPIFHATDTVASTRVLCAYVWEHRALWKALLTGGAAAVLKDEYLRLALNELERHRNPDSWLPGDLAVTFSVTSTLEILAWWLKQGDPPSAQHMAEVLERLTVRPILARDAGTR